MNTAEELQAQIDKMAIELDTLRKQVNQQRTQEFANRVSNAEEKFIAKRAKASGIDMNEHLPSGKEYTNFEDALRIRAAADVADAIRNKTSSNIAETERAYFKYIGEELKKDLDSEGKKGGKNKRKSQRQKINRRDNVRVNTKANVLNTKLPYDFHIKTKYELVSIFFTHCFVV